MIILDTNQLETLRPPNGPVLRILSKIAKALGGCIALPEMVLVEHMAHKTNRISAANEAYSKAGRALSSEIDYARTKKNQSYRFGESGLNEADILQQYSDALADVIPVILPTPAWASREALIREAQRRAPAYTRWDSGPGKGARDVAIWLTVLEAAAQSRDRDINFISEDKGFGGSAGLNNELKREIREWEGGTLENLRYYATVAGFLADVAADPVTPPPVDLVGTSQVVLDEVRAAIESSEAERALDTAAHSIIPHPPGTSLITTTTSTPTAIRKIDRVEKVSAYAMEGFGWASFQATWNIGAEYDIDARGGDGEQLFLGSVSAWGPFQTVIVCELDDQGEISAAEVTEVKVFRGASLSVSVAE
ncbi:PIN domain-containing protein [Streptomyces phaeochromogenes]|uniref:PIN domain-containing protein n=1 Tax=Streptomyces phaeochromogenes TaxID=1923 RepID=UPI0032461FB2